MLSYATVDFYLFYDWAAGMQIWALLTISQCSDSDTQGTVKALGPFVWVKMGEELQWYSPWNVLLSHLNGERTLIERWTNALRTQSERCVNAERNLVNDMWTVNGERTQKASGAQSRALSERWTQGERKMNDPFGEPRVFSSALSI